MVFKKTKKVPRGGDPLNWVHDQQVDAPRADMPGTKKLARNVRFNRWFIRAAIFILPVALLSNIILVANNLNVDDGSSAYEGPPPSSSTATIAVKQWLEADPSPLPGGEIISWDEYQQAPLPTGEQAKAFEESGIESVEVHSFTVASKTGTKYKVQVQLAVADGGEDSSVIGAPSLGPVAPPVEGIGSNLSPWPTLPDGTTTDEISTAITVWAKAFASGDPALLLNAVGDPRKGVSYVPLSGMVLNADEFNIKAVGQKWGEGEEPSAEATPKQMLVQVAFDAYWPGTVAENTSGESLPTLTYDLLIDKANTASPKVVAWSGPGAGYWLEPYANAVSGKVVASSDLSDSTEPTAGLEEGDE